MCLHKKKDKKRLHCWVAGSQQLFNLILRKRKLCLQKYYSTRSLILKLSYTFRENGVITITQNEKLHSHPFLFFRCHQARCRQIFNKIVLLHGFLFLCMSKTSQAEHCCYEKWIILVTLLLPLYYYYTTLSFPFFYIGTYFILYKLIMNKEKERNSLLSAFQRIYNMHNM